MNSRTQLIIEKSPSERVSRRPIVGHPGEGGAIAATLAETMRPLLHALDEARARVRADLWQHRRAAAQHSEGPEEDEDSTDAS